MGEGTNDVDFDRLFPPSNNCEIEFLYLDSGSHSQDSAFLLSGWVETIKMMESNSTAGLNVEIEKLPSARIAPIP